jgi:hypothetical protein
MRERRPGRAKTGLEAAAMVEEWVQTWELWSYVVTVIALPAAIIIFMLEQRKERENEEEEVYQLLSDNYQDFLKVCLEHRDLKLFQIKNTEDLTPEQREAMIIIFSMLVSLFERAYLLLYEPGMNTKQERRWRTWADYMHEWAERADFQEMLPELLDNEDPEFVTYLKSMVPTGKN